MDSREEALLRAVASPSAANLTRLKLGSRWFSRRDSTPAVYPRPPRPTSSMCAALGILATALLTAWAVASRSLPAGRPSRPLSSTLRGRRDAQLLAEGPGGAGLYFPMPGHDAALVVGGVDDVGVPTSFTGHPAAVLSQVVQQFLP